MTTNDLQQPFRKSTFISTNNEQAEKSTLLSKRARLFLLICFVLSSQVAAITLWEDLPGETFVDSIGIVFIAIGQWFLMTALTFVIFGIFIKLLFAFGRWVYEGFYRFPSRRD